MLDPRPDQRLVAFARLSLRHLWCHAVASEPVVEILRVETDPQAMFDEPGQTRRRPTLGGEPEIAGATIQPGENLLDLGSAELGRSASTRFGRQACFALPAEVVPPAANAAGADSEKLGNVLLAPSIGKPEHRQHSNLLQHWRRPWQH